MAPARLQLLPLLLLLLLLSHLLRRCLATDAFTVTLTGNSSYLTLPAWRPCPNASLAFEFRPTKDTGLLMYAEPGPGLFLHLSLVAGRLRFSLNLESGGPHPEGPLTTGAGRNLHLATGFARVALTVGPGWAAFRLGNRTETLRLREPRAQAGGAAGGPVYFGGLPDELTRDAQRRAFFGVSFEPNFAGVVRNVLYTDCVTGRLSAPSILSRRNSHLRQLPPCSTTEDGGCENGGLCLVGDDNRPFCFCPEAYIGPRCERQKDEVPTTFDGRGYIHLDINLSPHVWGLHGSTDSVRLLYRTRQSNAFLIYAGSEDSSPGGSADRRRDFIALSLRNWELHLAMSVNRVSRNVSIPPQQGGSRYQFADSQWHRIQVKRNLEKIEVLFDDRVIRSLTFEQSGSLNINTIFLGGFSSLPPGLVADLAGDGGGDGGTFFKGCMREARFQSDGADMDLLQLARDSRHGFRPVRMPPAAFGACADPHVLEPLQFRRPDAFLAVSREPTSSWSAQIGGAVASLAFSFATNEPDGLLVFIGSNRSDFLAFELRERQLYFLIDAGAGTVRLRLTGPEAPLSATDFNRVQFVNEDGGVGGRFVSVNGNRSGLRAGEKFRRFRRLDLGDVVYLGGLPAAKRFTAPPELHSAALGQGFVGVLANLSINGEGVDVVFEAIRRPAPPGVDARVTPPRTGLCSGRPCRNGGRCREGWDRFVCDCSATLYTGPTCEQKAPVLKFDGNGLVRVTFAMPLRTLVEDVTVSLRTNVSDGLIFATANTKSESGDSMQLLLRQGRLTCRVNYGSGPMNLETGDAELNDNRWHSVSIRRREADLEIVLDGKPKFTRSISYGLRGDNNSLVITDIYIGKI